MTIPALGAPLAPAATGVHPPAATSADDNAGFARQLELAAQPAPSGAPAAPARAPQESQGAQAQAQQRAKARASGDRPPAERVAKAGQKDADKATAGPAAAKPSDAADDASPSDLSAMLAGLLGHAQAPQTAARGDPKAAAGTTAAEAASGDGSAGRRDGRAALGAAADRGPQLRAHAEGEATLPQVRADAAQFALPPQLQQSTPAADAATRTAAPAYTAQVEAALGTPEFAPGLSAQVTVMLREGVQEARLQLNPAEMGPITVQIQIEGTSAQVDLAAEQAPTRQALEQALPTLAGALQENGLTLTGGGVFEQPRQARQPGDGEPGNDGAPRRFGVDGPAAAESAGPAAAPARRVVTRGVVDLYA